MTFMSITAADIARNLTLVKQRMAQAAQRAGRDPAQVQLVAITKYLDLAGTQAAVAAGLQVLGENRIQEVLPKIEALAGAPITWHFVGHLQSNKARAVVEHFQLMHSLDSLRLAEALSCQAEKLGKRQRVLLQVNVSGEDTKFGAEPGKVIDLVRQVAQLPGVRIEGLMTMAPYEAEPEQTRPVFRGLRLLRNQLRDRCIPNTSWEYLSMGMTNDLEVAIEEGATLVRIGSALFS